MEQRAPLRDMLDMLKMVAETGYRRVARERNIHETGVDCKGSVMNSKNLRTILMMMRSEADQTACLATRTRTFAGVLRGTKSHDSRKSVDGKKERAPKIEISIPLEAKHVPILAKSALGPLNLGQRNENPPPNARCQ